MDLTWLGRACFLLTTNDHRRVLFDPYLDFYKHSVGTTFPLPDMICVSHGHLDHFADVPDLVRGDSPALVVAIPELCRTLRELVPETQHRLFPLAWEDTVEIQAVRFSAFQSPPMQTTLYSMFAEFGVSKVLDFLQAARQLADDILYLPLTSFGVEVQGKRILHFIFEDEMPGHEVDVAHIGAHFRPDIALVSVEHGQELRAAEYAAALKAPIIIPHHYKAYGEFPDANMDAFGETLKELAPDVELRLMQELETLNL